jgi:hypothetical protein
MALAHEVVPEFGTTSVAIPRNLFADILRLIAALRSPPLLSTA